MAMIRIAFVGDTVVKDRQTNLADAEVCALLREHVLVSANLEAPVPSTGNAIRKVGPHLETSPQTAELLTQTGIHIASAANNHIADYGPNGIAATKAAIGIIPLIGAAAVASDVYRPYLTTVDGIRLGFISVAEWGFGAADAANSGGFAWVGHPALLPLVRTTATEVDVLVIQVHAGVEHFDLPLPEWRTFYRTLIEAGAKLVVGHHPHVAQGIEHYNGGVIAYSLGNFAFAQTLTSAQHLHGGILSVTISGTAIEDIVLHPVTCDVKNVVHLDQRAESKNRLETLNAQLAEPEETYNQRFDKLAEILWDSRYHHFYQRALGSYSTLRGLLRSVLEFARGRSTDYQLLSHNLNIESHRLLAARIAKRRSS